MVSIISFFRKKKPVKRRLIRVAHKKIVHHKSKPLTFRHQKAKRYYKSRSEDKRLSALKPGRRPAIKGRRKTYYEYRVNRADLNKKQRL